MTRIIAEIDADIAKVKAEMLDVHGTETEVYSRIVGYYRALSNNPKYDTWNIGQRAQFFKRKMFDPSLGVKEHFPEAKI